jgi:3-hydroxyisobutyrate dehydrogenase-like beta-hydroxyacid dehydrogenase
MRVGYLGIGIMGSGIVKNLRKAGVPVTFLVHRNRERVPELLAVGAREATDCAALAAASDAIMMTLPDSSVVEPLLLGPDGIGPHLGEGQIVVDMSTSDPRSTQQIAAVLQARGIAMLDAPLTGSRQEAESGTLNVMCGGPVDSFERVKPLFQAIAKNVFHVGPAGAGHTVKLMNNFLGQINAAAICELLPLAGKAGIDLKTFMEVISVSGGNSRMFQGLMPRLIQRDSRVMFQEKFVHKDVRYFAALMNAHGLGAPMAATLLAVHDAAMAKGYGERDFSALAEFYPEIARNIGSAGHA